MPKTTSCLSVHAFNDAIRNESNGDTLAKRCEWCLQFARIMLVIINGFLLLPASAVLKCNLLYIIDRILFVAMYKWMTSLVNDVPPKQIIECLHCSLSLFIFVSLTIISNFCTQPKSLRLLTVSTNLNAHEFAYNFEFFKI